MRQTLQIPSLAINQLVPTWIRAWANDMLSNDGITQLSNNKLISFVIIYLLSIIVNIKVALSAHSYYILQCHYCHLDYLKSIKYPNILL